MTEADLDRIERELGIKLPASYRETMLNFPIRACAGNEDFALWDSADGLISLNRRYRDEFSWPAHLYALGEAEGDECTHALDLRDPGGPVWWIDHWQPDAKSSGPIEPAFSTWIEKYVRDWRSDLEREGIDPDGNPEERRRIEEESARQSRTALLVFIGLAVLIGTAILVVVTW